MCAVKDCLFKKIADTPASTGNKITVVGVGQVGMACAFTMLAKGVTNELCLIDKHAEKAKGEMMDLQHGGNFLRNPKITASTDYAATAGSRICVVTAGVRQEKDETRLQLLGRNTDLLKEIIPNLVKASPNTILLMVTNPVDVITHVALKLSGLPKNRVIGSGTNLDSARFRFLMSQRLCNSFTSCNAWIIGEHGDSSVPVWSGANVAGVLLQDLNPEIGSEKDPEKWNEMHQQVVKAAYEVIKLKGYTSWAIGLNVAWLVNSMLLNTSNIAAVSSYAKGHQSIEQDVCLSLPSVINANGITDVVQMTLTPTEQGLLEKSAKIINEITCQIKI